MAVLLLTSCGGSPGVTTTAVGLALVWPRPVLLADVDPGAHQAVLAGYLVGRSSHGKGLLRIAEAHRDRRPLREAVIDQCLPLGAEAGDHRLFLPGFTQAGSATWFGPVWEELVETFDRLDDLGYDVLVDAGRISPLGLPAPLLERSDLSCVVVGSSLRAVMSARVHLPAVTGGDGGHRSRRTGLLVVGEGHPYRAGEIGQALGAEVLATLPSDPTAAAHFSDGAPAHRRFESSPLVRALRGTASQLSDLLQRDLSQVAGRP